MGWGRSGRGAEGERVRLEIGAGGMVIRLGASYSEVSCNAGVGSTREDKLVGAAYQHATVLASRDTCRTRPSCQYWLRYGDV
eukprot:55063-Rhodomonas_salina.1